MRAVNLDTYCLSLLTAKEDILNPRSSTNWALFSYEDATNSLKLSDSGAGGMSELAEKFHVSRPLYGLYRLGTQTSGQPHIIMINWVGETVDEYRRAECASHIPAIKAFFKEARLFLSASRPEDVTEEKINQMFSKIGVPAERIRKNSSTLEKEATVGTNYRKTNAAMEMQRINRESFWARAEREEEERKEEERRKAAEERRRRERERILQERKEAEERDKKMEEKLQMIEDQRRMQAKLEAEARKQEKTRWEQQQREYEDDMRSRYRRSESIEKAAEAAALVSQRANNPREFFRQLSSSSSLEPGSPRIVKPPFRRYQRSLTDTAFIFGRSNSSTPTSPRSPTVVSPFSRVPNSPFHQTMSPTRPAEQPPTPLHAPLVSPPRSPPCPAPIASLPSPPPSKPCPPLEDPTPQEPEITNGISQLSTSAASPGPVLGQNFSAEASAIPLPVNPRPTTPAEDVYRATRMLADLELDEDLTVQAVLVDTHITSMSEEQEETEETCAVETKEPGAHLFPVAAIGHGEIVPVLMSPQLHLEPTADDKSADPFIGSNPNEFSFLNPEKKLDSPSASTGTGATDLLNDEVEEEGVGHPKVEDHWSEEPSLSEKPGTEQHEEEEACEEQPEEVENEEVESEKEEADLELSAEEEVATIRETQQGPDSAEEEPPEEYVTMSHKAQVQNAEENVQNGHSAEHNGTVQWHSSPEDQEVQEQPFIALKQENDFTTTESSEEEEDEEEEQKCSSHRQLCVRALYDYLAEDESELSLELGDIIQSVERVDKAWWRGRSKDGRWGLFPANYVETI